VDTWFSQNSITGEVMGDFFRIPGFLAKKRHPHTDTASFLPAATKPIPEKQKKQKKLQSLADSLTLSLFLRTLPLPRKIDFQSRIVNWTFFSGLGRTQANSRISILRNLAAALEIQEKKEERKERREGRKRKEEGREGREGGKEKEKEEESRGKSIFLNFL
jgi:hypothetical protein